MNMRRLIILLFFLISISSKAQVTISGKITDNHNKILQGISISIKDSYDGTTSDSLGNFSFITTAKGVHILQASASGYKTFEQNTNINSTALNINITLKDKLYNFLTLINSARLQILL